MVAAIKVPMSTAAAKALEAENERLAASAAVSAQTSQKLFEALKKADAVSSQVIDQLEEAEADVARLEARQLLLISCVLIFGMISIALSIGLYVGAQ